MIYNDVLIAGYGGQGVLLAGKLLAWAGMAQGLNVTWFPSYGAEIRGGTANCTVIMSDEEIGSPVVDSPGALIAMNQASADKFTGRIKKGGVILLNSSLAKVDVIRAGVRVIKIPANEIAEELGDVKVVNMVMLGAYIKAVATVSRKNVVKAVEAALPERRRSLLPMNIEALERGGSMVGDD